VGEMGAGNTLVVVENGEFGVGRHGGGWREESDRSRRVGE
jgi:hypothetical protein